MGPENRLAGFFRAGSTVKSKSDRDGSFERHVVFKTPIEYSLFFSQNEKSSFSTGARRVPFRLTMRRPDSYYRPNCISVNVPFKKNRQRIEIQFCGESRFPRLFRQGNSDMRACPRLLATKY